MKNYFLSLTAIFLLSGLSSFASKEKTLNNLEVAFNDRNNASLKYTAYARQADKEGLPGIALLFRATAKSESIHASRFESILKENGKRTDTIKNVFAVKSTKDNLNAALKYIDSVSTVLYPRFIENAKERDPEVSNSAG